MSAPDVLDQLVAALSFIPSLLNRQCELYRWQALLVVLMLALRLLYARVRDPIMEMRLQVEQMELPRCRDVWTWVRRVCRLRAAPLAVQHPAARVSPTEYQRVQSATTEAALATLRLDPRYRFRISEIESDPVSTSGGNWQHGRFAHVNLLGDPAFDEPPATEAQGDRRRFAEHVKCTLCEWMIVFVLGQLQTGWLFAAAARTIRVPLVAGLMLLLFPLAPIVWRLCFIPPAYRSNAARFRASPAPLWRRILALLVDWIPILMQAAATFSSPQRAGQSLIVGPLTLTSLTLCAQALICFPVHASFGARLLDLQFVRMPSGEVDRRWLAVLAWLWIDVLLFCVAATGVLRDRTFLFTSLVMHAAEFAFLLVKRRSMMESCCRSKVIVAASPAADDEHDD